MKTNKILLGGIAGGLIIFLANGLVYEVLLKDYVTANYNQCFMKPEGEMIWWAMILSSLALGCLLSWGFSWSNTTGVMAGAKVAGIFGILLSVSMDLQFYAFSTMFKGLSVVLVDIIVASVMLAITGAGIAWVMAMVKK